MVVKAELNAKKKDMTEEFPIIRVTKGGENKFTDLLATEQRVTIIFNNQEPINLVCSPMNLNYLAVGFLFSQGLISHRTDIQQINATDDIIYVEAKSNHQAESRSPKPVRLAAKDVFNLINKFQSCCHLFRLTGSIHSAALCSTSDILLFTEDISRHSCVDKLVGECILRDILTSDKLIIISSRVSSEIVARIARLNIPVIVSKSAPTNLAVRLATDCGITLIGFARGSRMNIYTKRDCVEKITRV